MTNLMLNMICRNEIENLPRALASVIGVVSSYAILDTGSTDGTQDFIREFFEANNIPGEVKQSKFVDFSQARNEGLAHAWEILDKLKVDDAYIILMDADMELEWNNNKPELDAPAYLLNQKQGDLIYDNIRLLRDNTPAQYYGRTHEYLSVEGAVNADFWSFKDHATGSNRKFKSERDLRLLKKSVEENRKDERAWFYLAQTYREMGAYNKALMAYKQRIKLGGWDEEVWYSQLMIARIYKSLDKNEEFQTASLKAFEMRPSRAEPLHDLARFHREKGNNALGFMFADAGRRTPMPTNALFVETNTYEHGFTEEISITGYYNPGTRKQAFDACDVLALNAQVPEPVRNQARTNITHYLVPLKVHANSFTPRKIEFKGLKPLYVATNPSIASSWEYDSGNLMMILRTVNYKIREDGTYDMQGDTSIRTANYLLSFDPDTYNIDSSYEIFPPDNWPAPITTDVLGFEDMRLIVTDKGLFANACVLERNSDWWREQYFVELNPTGKIIDYKYMPTPNILSKQHEKNWMPFVDTYDEIKFMYQPGTVINTKSEVITQRVPNQAVDTFRGGGQMIDFDGGWLSIIHEAFADPTTGKRAYQHRFVAYSTDMQINGITRPFVFESRQVEFAAGLCWHPTTDEIIISYGIRDCEAWMGTVDPIDIRNMLWQR